MQLRFTSLLMVNSPRDFQPQCPLPARSPALNAPFDVLERWVSWPFSIAQSCHPVGGVQNALLTLANEMQLTAVQLSPTTRSCSEVQLDSSSIHFPIRLSDFDLWTVEKPLAQGPFHLSLTGLRALPARKAGQPDDFITSLCIQCRVMSAPASRGLIFRN